MIQKDCLLFHTASSSLDGVFLSRDLCKIIFYMNLEIKIPHPLMERPYAKANSLSPYKLFCMTRCCAS